MTCKGCSAPVRHTKEVVKALAKDHLALELDVVTDQTYQKQLRICAQCPSLQL